MAVELHHAIERAVERHDEHGTGEGDHGALQIFQGSFGGGGTHATREQQCRTARLGERQGVVHPQRPTRVAAGELVLVTRGQLQQGAQRPSLAQRQAEAEAYVGEA